MLNPVFSLPAFALPVMPVAISWDGWYVLLTFIVGVLIGYQAISLKQHQGKLPKTPLFTLSSMAETLWFFISGLMLYFAEPHWLTRVVLASYVLYAAFGWVYSIYLLKNQSDRLTQVKDLDEIAMPTKYLDYMLAFAWVITGVCVLVLIELYRAGVYGF